MAEEMWVYMISLSLSGDSTNFFPLGTVKGFSLLKKCQSLAECAPFMRIHEVHKVKLGMDKRGTRREFNLLTDLTHSKVFFGWLV